MIIEQPIKQFNFILRFEYVLMEYFQLCKNILAYRNGNLFLMQAYVFDVVFEILY